MFEKTIAITVIISAIVVPPLVYSGAYYAGRYSDKIKAKIKWKYSDCLYELVVTVGSTSVLMGYFYLIYLILK